MDGENPPDGGATEVEAEAEAEAEAAINHPTTENGLDPIIAEACATDTSDKNLCKSGNGENDEKKLTEATGDSMVSARDELTNIGAHKPELTVSSECPEAGDACMSPRPPCVEDETPDQSTTDTPPTDSSQDISSLGSSATDQSSNTSQTNEHSPDSSPTLLSLATKHSSNHPANSEDSLLSELDNVLSSESHSSIDSGRTELVNPETWSVERGNGESEIVNLMDIPAYRQLKMEKDGLTLHIEQLTLDNHRLLARTSQLTKDLTHTQQLCQKYEAKLKDEEQNDNEKIYAAQITGLEETIAKLEKELKTTRETLSSHDSSAKRAVAVLQTELKSQVDKARTVYEETRREKESMTMKYAQAEQKNIELQQKQCKMEVQMREMVKEREVVINRFKVIKTEKHRMQEMFDSRAAEMAGLRKELEKLKEALQAADMKVKWHQNKLKTEVDGNKELKVRTEELTRKLKEAKEETEMIRRDCQEMIKKYQSSEEIRSNSLEKEVKVKDEKLQQQLQETTDRNEVHTMVMKELESLKIKYKDTIEELKTMRDKVTCLEAERITQEHTLDKFKETLQSQKTENKDLLAKLARLETVEGDLVDAKSHMTTLESKLTSVEQSNRELQIDMEGCAGREGQHLEFSQKVSDKNAQLQSENNSLSNKLRGVTAEQQRLSEICDNLGEKVIKLESTLSCEKEERTTEVSSLTSSLSAKSKAVEELSRAVEEEKDENRTLKRKHNANTKDLLRQLQQSRKRVESYEQVRPAGDGISVSSRTSSNGSLDTIGVNSHMVNSHNSHTVNSQDHESPPHEMAPPFVQVVEIDKQMLVEKIVKLQRLNARRSEKLEFMEDHVNQLIADIKKKTRIIQNYVMREESGALSPDSVDRNKAQLAKKGGIMASLYNSHSEDGAMSLDLSLEINHKLQSVLEDTLLKNITFKENLETLGQEISRLSQENRQIKLSALEKS